MGSVFDAIYPVGFEGSTERGLVAFESNIFGTDLQVPSALIFPSEQIVCSYLKRQRSSLGLETNE